MLVDISKIVVTDRIRKDFGDISELANDIAKNGLIEPIAVDKDMVLIAGERRLRACQSLGMTQIPIHIIDVREKGHAIEMEISENEVRKAWTFTERMIAAEKLLEAKRAEGKARMGAHGSSKQEVDDSNFRADRETAKELGIGSYTTLRNGLYVHQRADAEMRNKLDKGEMTINAAFLELRKKYKNMVKRYEKLEADEDANSDRMEELYLENVALKEKLQAINRGQSLPENPDLVAKIKELSKANTSLSQALDHKDGILDTKDALISKIIDGIESKNSDGILTVIGSLNLAIATFENYISTQNESVDDVVRKEIADKLVKMKDLAERLR